MNKWDKYDKYEEYVAYLTQWINEHPYVSFANCLPDCYDEWLANKIDEMEQKYG